MTKHNLYTNFQTAGIRLDELTLQSFTDANPKPQPDPLAQIFPHSFVKIKQLTKQGAGVFWCVNPQEKGKRGIHHTVKWCAVGMDLDVAKEADDIDQDEISEQKQAVLYSLSALEFVPTGIIETKNGLQPYWLFDEPQILSSEESRTEANEVYKQVIKGLEAAVGFTSEGDSISRVLRLEGSLHQKNPNDTFEITAIGDSGQLVHREDFIAKYQLKTEQKKRYKPLLAKKTRDSIYDFDVIEGLTKLSGSDLVNDEEYEFEQERSGKRQIIINGQRTGQWIDVVQNAIGGHPGGEGSFNIVRWVKWYQSSMSEEEIRRELDILLLGKDPEELSSFQSFQVDEYQVIVNDGRYITVRRDNLEYKLKAVGNKHEVSLYFDGNLTHRDMLTLSSSRSRKLYAKECGELDPEDVANDLLKLTECLDELNRQVLNQEDEAKEEKPSDEEVTAAEELLTSPILLYQILQMIKKLGVAGEEVTALLHYLVFTSRITANPLSVVVKGESSVGKSYVVSKVMQLLPKDAYIDITDATAQSFFYAPEDHFAHKIIVIFELHGSDKADYSIRSLQSEGKLKIQVTIKDPETGEFRAKEKEVNGPTGFITTTTNAKIHSENETRHLSIFPDESIEQTELTFSVSDAKYRGIFPVSQTTLKPWQVLQDILKPHRVLIPFVEELRRQFPKEPVRVRRDYNKLLSMIEVIALLHQKQRQIISENDQEYVVATLVDFHIAKVLLENTFKKTIYAIPPKTELLIKTAGELVKAGKHDGVSINELAKKVGWDYDTAKKWFDPGYRKGYFERTREHKGSTAALYVTADKQLPSENILPFTEDLFAIDTTWLGEQDIYDPISGETYQLEPEE